jgi:hypothetical protein
MLSQALGEMEQARVAVTAQRKIEIVTNWRRLSQDNVKAPVIADGISLSQLRMRGGIPLIIIRGK